MNSEIQTYNDNQSVGDQDIVNLLLKVIDQELTGYESKIWHSHPVCFHDGYPIVGYSKQKKGIRLMFWSGASFEEEKLNVLGKILKMPLFSIIMLNRSTSMM